MEDEPEHAPQNSSPIITKHEEQNQMDHSSQDENIYS